MSLGQASERDSVARPGKFSDSDVAGASRQEVVAGASRQKNEVSPAHPLMLTLKEMEKERAVISQIALKPLAVHQMDRLVAETLSCSEELALPLTELLYRKTQGNPFFTTQFLKGLHEEKLIWFDLSLGYWKCDLSKVREAVLTDDVVEFVAGRLQKLPEATQNVLKLAACIGDRFDLEMLATVCQKSSQEVAADIWEALQEGLILPISEAYKFYRGTGNGERGTGNGEFPRETKIYSVGSPLSKGGGGGIPDFLKYKFLHDRVREAAYSLISEDQKQRAHLQIGNLLLNNTSMEGLEERIFDIVNQINLGSSLIIQPSERRRLARLNIMAGKKAKMATAYAAAFKYTENARSLLPYNYWQEDYKEALFLYELSAETAYLAGEFTEVEILTNILLDNAREPLDSAKAYEVKIQLFNSQNQLLEAIQVALNFLSILGIDLPENPDEIDAERGLIEIHEKLSQRRIESLISLPIMSDRRRLASMGILSAILNSAYLGMPNLLPIIVAKQVELSVTYGNTDASPSAYANYGLILCGIVGEIDSGYRFGNLALNLLNKIESQEFAAKTIEIVGLSIKHWKEHINSTLKLLLNGYKIGCEWGDLEAASFAAYDYCAHSWVSGTNLIDLEEEMLNYSAKINEFKQKMVFNLNELHRQTVLNLIENNENPYLLKGKAYDEEEMLPIHKEDSDFSSLALFYIDKLFLCYLFGECEKALEIGAIAESYLEGIPGQVFVPWFYLYDALSQLYLYLSWGEKERSEARSRILSHEAKMAQWADCAPANYAHKLHLIQAEKHRAWGDRVRAIELYELAIAGAKENKYVQEEALANELAAKFYLEWNKEKAASGYMQEAYYCYARWGAKTKTQQLEQIYPQLLAPILQQSEFHPHLKHPQALNSTIAQVTSMTSALDFASAIKAGRAISGEMQLEALLSQLIRIVIENAGADKGALILDNSGAWEIVAWCDRGNFQLSHIPLEEAKTLPNSIINTVKRTRETILLDRLEKETAFAGEPYLSEQQPKSLFCTPILNQGKLIGILYLENKLTAGAFTSDRVEVLNLLTAQAAISIENARLYNGLEVKVEARTRELQEKNQDLQQTLEQLQQTQGQLIQTEKMSALGKMVAGIAHEINNPITFISGNIGHAREYLRDLLDLLALYEDNASRAVIGEKAEAIELEYLREDLENILDSMQNGSDRIGKIILGLRNFSRLDEAERKRVEVREGLENTLLILQHRLQNSDSHPEIAIVKNYGKLPPIDCYPSQLNQVFLHILSNAIDALTGSRARNSPEIRITTEMPEAQTARICIADNGPGMSEEVRQKVFDPFFTTKPVGRATGLGLSISYQIVTERHRGRLQCISQLERGTEFIIEIPKWSEVGGQRSEVGDV